MSKAHSKAYALIRSHYGSRRARRSGVPLINHIDEGLCILNWLGADEPTKDAFALHPFLQADDDLCANWKRGELSGVPAASIVLAMEYRRVADNYLSGRELPAGVEIELSPLREVNQMLIADKVQNFKDFRAHHLRTHPRSEALDQYFRSWLTRLDISFDQFREWEAKLLSGAFNHQH